MIKSVKSSYLNRKNIRELRRRRNFHVERVNVTVEKTSEKHSTICTIEAEQRESDGVRIKSLFCRAKKEKRAFGATCTRRTGVRETASCQKVDYW